LTASPSFTEKPNYRHEEENRSKSDKEAEEGALEVDDDQIVLNQDPFVPWDDLPEEQYYVARVRSIIIGILCGTLVNASNIYLGLKTGWTFTANLFGVRSA